MQVVYLTTNFTNLDPVMDNITTPHNSITALIKNVTQAQLVAADPSTDPELLRELGLSIDQQTRQSVAGNPNTPVDVLLRLGAEFPSQLLDNPVFPLLLLENLNLVADIPLPTLRSILKQENVPVYILEQAADQADLEVQLGLVKNVQTPKGVLNRLTQSRHPQVVESARLHINLAGELTEKYEQRIKEVIKGIIPSARQAGTGSLAVLTQICPVPEFMVEHWVQDSSYKDFFCRKLAYSPATFPNVLKHLANHTDGWTWLGVAENPNTPTETLRKLFTEKQASITLARNLNTPTDVLESLSTNQDQRVRIRVARNPNTPLNVVKGLANDTDIHVAQTAATLIAEQKGEYTAEAVRKNPKTPPDVLEKLAQKDPRTVGEHPNTPPELLLEFSKSVDERLRESVAKNPNAPVRILEQLADDESWEVRRGVAKNPNVPISLLFKQLARDTWVNSAIAYQMSSKKYNYPEAESILDILAEESTSPLETILQRLSQDGGEAARLFLARRFDLPANFLTQFAESTEVKVCEGVAQNLNTPVSSLEKLAQSPETKVREAVAQNPNTPISILEQLSKDNYYDVLLHIAQKTNLSPEILEELAGSKSDQVREKAMLNPSLPKEAVERILCGEYATGYLKLNPDFLSRHPDSLAMTLNHYAKSQFPLVSFIALNQPQISQELLQEKSLSISWLERLAIAQNPQATQQILIQLAQDSNQLVRAAAKDRLQNLSQS
ncbi:hypothetical protein [Nostoc sp. JL33]|uniref:hypothetical protein n=2 Tax=Nostoc TaxID=1177 RepID=UPI0025F449B2|nr:hypothetical protein [Nostoc sp. JL33]